MCGIKVFFWPDSTWMFAADHEDEIDKWRGFDFGTTHVPEDWDGDQIEHWVSSCNKSLHITPS